MKKEPIINITAPENRTLFIRSLKSLYYNDRGINPLKLKGLTGLAKVSFIYNKNDIIVVENGMIVASLAIYGAYINILKPNNIIKNEKLTYKIGNHYYYWCFHYTDYYFYDGTGKPQLCDEYNCNNAPIIGYNFSNIDKFTWDYDYIENVMSYHLKQYNLI